MDRKKLATFMLLMMFSAILIPTHVVKASMDDSEDELDINDMGGINNVDEENDLIDDSEDNGYNEVVDSSDEDETNGADDGEDDNDYVDDNDEMDDDENEADDTEDKEDDEIADEDGDDVDDEVEDNSEREISTELEDNEITIKSKIENEDTKNEFEVNLSSGDGISIMLKYGKETGASSEEVKAELYLSVEFLSIVEYIDTDGSGTLTEDDNIIQTLNLEELSYSQPIVSAITSIDGETGYIFESNGTLKDFEFSITAELYSNYALVDNTLVSPTETKITIGIKNFPFINEDSSMALQIRASSEMNIEEESANMVTEIKVKSETAEGFFSWIPTALVDSVDQPVGSYVITGEETLISLSYHHGTEIIHDPIFGINILEPIKPIFTIPIYVFSIVVLTLVALALFFIGRRETKYEPMLTIRGK